MKKILSIVTTFVGVMLFSSCEDFLNLNPTNQAPKESSIQTSRDADVMINGLMREMTSSSYYGRNFVLYGDAKGGDLAVRSLSRGQDALYMFNHSASTNSYSDFWSQMYYCILQINNLLENIEEIEAGGPGANNFTNHKGQLLTLRALIYFDLVRLYGEPYTENNAALGVPLMTKVTDVYNTPQRATVAQIYAQIFQDLTGGAPMLSKNLAKGYVNYYANRAISARVHLHMGNYQEALIAAEEIITSNKYTLYTNETWLASWASEFGSESIFELAMYQDEADLEANSLGYHIRRYNKPGSSGGGQYIASDYFLERLGEDPDDIRWKVMERDEISADRLGCCNKYTGGPDEKGDKGSISAVNIKVFRLSEIYLIAAEASLSTDPAKATDYLNTIKKRSPNLAPATPATITLDMILDEKSKELFGEGQRFFDMIRLDKTITFNDDILQGAISSTIRPKTIDRTFYKTILPIPKSELDANPAIASQQNSGY
ncbi:RagB/SusD family nutrient uptake outer membrane protein [termite gut metagenome]|uniref:RagB/SusD family nutrient uptake outer membrane protein n=1 Tax=termite gut metagenome TaxID=433724 RepID=A0A5J4R3N8_9ZZZZ